MTRLERFHFLSYFGNGKAMPYFQIIQIGTLYISNPATKVRYDIRILCKKDGKKFYQYEMERMFRDALENNLIERVNNENIKTKKLEDSYIICKEDYDYKISSKGDEILRAEQIERDGDYNFYKKFDRTLDSAKQINPDLFN